MAKQEQLSLCTYRAHFSWTNTELHTLFLTLGVILYFLVVWPRAIFSSTQTATILGDQDISKCLYNLFLAVEQTSRISLASFSGLQSLHMINRAFLVESLRDQTISKSLSNGTYHTI